MDKNTFSQYGWVIVAVIITSLLIASAAPIANGAMVSINLIPDKLESAFGVGGSSDGAGVQPAYKLDTPTNLQFSEDDILTFDGVDFAEGYEITFKNGVTSVVTNCEDTTVDLSSIFSVHNGYAYIDVVATSEHPLYSNSDPATYIVGRVLSAPTNITLNADRVLSFDEVDHATGYIVTLGEENVFNITTNSLNLSEQLAARSGTVAIDIQAIDETGKYQNSAVSTYDAMLGYTITISDGVKADYSYHSDTGVITLPAASSRSGYRFKYWSDGTSLYYASRTITVEQDTTFRALWNAMATYKDSDGNVLEVVEIYSTYIEVASAPAGIDSDHYFVGWKDMSTSTLYVPGQKLYTSKPVTLTAVVHEHVKVTYTVTIQYNADALWKDVSETVTGTERDGAVFTTPLTGGVKPVSSMIGQYYLFSHWLVNGEKVNPGDSIVLYGDATCVAVYSTSYVSCSICAMHGCINCGNFMCGCHE